MMNSHWNHVKFSTIANFKNGLNFGSSEHGNSIKILGVGDFKDKSEISDISSLSEIYLNQVVSKDYLLQDEDLVFVRSNGNKALVGRCLMIYPRGIDVTFSGFSIRARLTSKEVLPKFILSLMRAGIIKKSLSSEGRGTNISNLNQEMLSNISVPLPPLPEQQSIVDLLECWDKAIALTEKLVKAKEKRFLAFTNKYLKKETKSKFTFGDIFSSAHLKNTDDLNLEIISVTTGGIVFQSEYFNKDVASVDKRSYLIVERDMLVMSGLNFWMGAIDFQRICDKGLVSPAYKVFRLNNTGVDKDYMAYFVRSHLMTRVLLEASIQGASIVRRNLDMEKLKSTIIKLPTYEDQIKISNMLNEAENDLNISNRILALLKKQKQALMQKLLSGEWRVKA